MTRLEDFFDISMEKKARPRMFRFNNMLKNFSIHNPVDEIVEATSEEYHVPNILQNKSLFSVSAMSDNIVTGILFNEHNQMVSLTRVILPKQIATLPKIVKNAIAMVVDCTNNRSLTKQYDKNFTFLTYDMQNIRCLPHICKNTSFGIILNGKQHVLDMVKNIYSRNNEAEITMPIYRELSELDIHKLMAHKSREDNHQRLLRLIENNHDLDVFKPDTLPLSHFSTTTKRYIENLINTPAPLIEEINDKIQQTYRKKTFEVSVTGDMYTFEQPKDEISLFLYSDASCMDDVITGSFALCDENAKIYKSGDINIEGSKFTSSNFGEIFSMEWALNRFKNANIHTAVSDSAFALSILRKKIADKQFIWVKGHNHNAINVYVDTLARLKNQEITDDLEEKNRQSIVKM